MTTNTVRPARAKVTPVVHEGANSRITRIGWAAMIVMTDGSTRVCNHSHNDKKGNAIRRCAQAMVNELNAAVSH